MDEKKTEKQPSQPKPTEPKPKKEVWPKRRTNDPNRFVWEEGDLTPVQE